MWDFFHCLQIAFRLRFSFWLCFPPSLCLEMLDQVVTFIPLFTIMIVSCSPIYFCQVFLHAINLSHLSTGSVSFAFFTAVQSYGWPFICLIFILDAYTNHWSMQFWILYMSSRFSFILLWRYLSFGQLRKAAFLRLSLLTFPTALQFSNVHIAGCQLNRCKSIFSFSIL